VLPYFVLGIALLAGLLLAARWFAGAEPAVLVKVLKRLVFGVVLGVIVFLVVTGQMRWALFALPALLPWFFRLRGVARAAKNFSRMASGSSAPTGQTSEVQTRFLRLSLDHDTGEMTGEVVAGAYRGRQIEEMGPDELIELLSECMGEDEQSAQVVEAYLDRVHADWRNSASASASAGAGGGKRASANGSMSREEAYQVLGLEKGAGTEQIKEAYHRLMAGTHPDHGGSTYLAAKINQAKDLLLGD
jgi:hypothetical protein